MAITLDTDAILAIGAIIVAAVAIFMFMRATDGVSTRDKTRGFLIQQFLLTVQCTTFQLIVVWPAAAHPLPVTAE